MLERADFILLYKYLIWLPVSVDFNGPIPIGIVNKAENWLYENFDFPFFLKKNKLFLNF